MEQARPRLPVVVKGVADPLQVARVSALPQVDDLLIDFVRQLLRHVVRVQPERMEQSAVKRRHLFEEPRNLAQVPGKGGAALTERGVILFGVNQLPEREIGVAPAGDAAQGFPAAISRMVAVAAFPYRHRSVRRGEISHWRSSPEPPRMKANV